MSLQLRRGSNDDRTQTLLQDGELVYASNTKKLYIGDGITYGGFNVLSTSAGVGLQWNETTQQLDISAVSLETANITESESTNLYFTELRAQNATAYLFTHDPTAHTGITFQYDDVYHTLSATVTASMSSDTTPTLNGDLTLNDHDIIGSGNLNYTGNFSNGSISLSANIITDSTNNGLNMVSTNAKVLTVNGISPNTIGNITDIPHITMAAARASNTELTANSSVGGLLFKGKTTSAAYTVTSGIYSNLTAAADINAVCPASTLTVMTGKKNQSSYNTFVFDENGAFTAPIIKATSYATGTYPGSIFSDAQAGWIIFDSTTKKFMGYDGTTWVALN